MRSTIKTSAYRPAKCRGSQVHKLYVQGHVYEMAFRAFGPVYRTERRSLPSITVRGVAHLRTREGP